MESKINSSFGITNVRVFDGNKLTEPRTVVVENGLISSATTSEIEIDGHGLTLIPGLIDAHAHMDVVAQLELAAKAGVTTMFEMAHFSPEVIDSLRNNRGVASILSCYYPALAGPKMSFPKGSIIAGVADAERYVKEVVALGADFIKIIIENAVFNEVTQEIPKAFTIEEVAAIVAAAHKYGKLTVAHVVTPLSYEIGLEAGVDILTHTPIAAALPQSVIDTMKAKGTIDIPTMIIMKGGAKMVKERNPNAPVDFQNVLFSVGKMHEAGITILAGTDANDQPEAPFQLPHGTSMHDELELLVQSGLTATEALRSATSITAKVFGLIDRGTIEPGKRADFVLIKGDPTKDISAVRNIQGVWIEGIHVE